MSYYVEVWDAQGQRAAAQATIEEFSDVLAWFEQYEKADLTLIWRILPNSGNLTSDEQTAFRDKGKRVELI